MRDLAFVRSRLRPLLVTALSAGVLSVASALVAGPAMAQSTSGTRVQVLAASTVVSTGTGASTSATRPPPKRPPRTPPSRC